MNNVLPETATDDPDKWSSNKSFSTLNSPLNFAQIGEILREGWRLLIVVSLFFALLGLSAALFLPKWYRAEAVLIPVPDSTKSGVAALSQVSGLADLAGASLGTSTNVAEAKVTLTSHALVMRYIEQKNLLPILFADKWDNDKSTWKSTDPNRIPTLWRGWRYFTNKIYKVNEDRKNGTITVSVDWKSPELAAQWVNDLVFRANAQIRERAIKSSERNIQYLDEQVRNTSSVEVQQAIYRLMENELKQMMIARGTDEYALRVLDAAIPPEKPVWPNIPIFILLSTNIGIVLGWIYVTFRYRASRRRIEATMP